MLNPELHANLINLFKKVYIHSEDKPAEGLEFVSGSSLTRDRVRPHFKPKGGEQYGLDCPFCKKKDKLYISHMYGTKAKNPGGEMVPCAKNVFHCYYCEFDKKDRNKFNKFITALDSGITGDIVIDAEAIQRAEQAILNRKPENHFPVCYPLTSPDATCAREYLRYRNYDVNDVINNWGALYSIDPEYFMHPYIVFPVFIKNKLVTWQARYIGDDCELRGAPKYYFDPSYKKSHVIHNMDRARHNTLGVLVEGIPSVIRIGTRHGITAFGKHPSVRQLKLLRGMYGQGTLVVMFDNDAIEETREKISEWRARGFFRNLINIEMPDDNDPADYTTEQVWCMINEKLKEQTI